MADRAQNLIAHLTVLRNCLVRVAVFFFVSLGICYYFAAHLEDILIHPLKPILAQGRFLIYTSLPEAFFNEINVALFASTILTLPFFLMQIWLFVSPGLYEHEQKIMRIVLIAIPFLFYLGVAFALLLVLPRAFDFFISFEHKNLPLYFLPKFGDYISFTQRLMVVFGLGFELPVVLFTLVRLGMMGLDTLKSNWRIVIFTICAISAVITPPDALSMIALAVPMITLYGLTVLVIQCTQSKIEKYKDSHA